MKSNRKRVIEILPRDIYFEPKTSDDDKDESLILRILKILAKPV